MHLAGHRGHLLEIAMPIDPILRVSDPLWDALPAGKDKVPGALGGFTSTTDAAWAVKAREVLPALVALHDAVTACLAAEGKLIEDAELVKVARERLVKAIAAVG